MPSNIFLTSNFINVASSILPKLGTKEMTVVVVTTATETYDKAPWLESDWDILEQQKNIKLFKYTITGKTEQTIIKDLGDIDILYIAGGNVFFLLQEAQKNGFAKLVKSHVAKGKIYIGQSAGSIIAGPDIWPTRRSDTIGDAPDINGYEGFGLINFVVLPHWGSESKRQQHFGERLENVYNEDNIYVLLNDYQYIECADDVFRLVDVRV
jgi:dipeptidase E